MLSDTLKRPTDYSQLIGNKDLIKTLKEMENMPNLLFYGPAGVGKTTIIKIMTNKFDKRNVLELNASDDRGIGVVREIIKPFCSTSAFPNPKRDENSEVKKIVILDEVDSMSKDAQNSLRRIMEDHRKVRFCLICNYVNKLIPAIISRCARFRFSLIKKEEMTERLSFLLKEENIEFEEKALDRISGESNGDMRKCLNDLNGIFYTYKNIKMASTDEYYGYEFTKFLYEKIVKEIKEKKINEAFKILFENNKFKFSLRSILKEIEDEKIVNYCAILEDKINKNQNEDLLQIGLFSKIVSIYSEK